MQNEAADMLQFPEITIPIIHALWRAAAKASFFLAAEAAVIFRESSLARTTPPQRSAKEVLVKHFEHVQ